MPAESHILKKIIHQVVNECDLTERESNFELFSYECFWWNTVATFMEELQHPAFLHCSRHSFTLEIRFWHPSLKDAANRFSSRSFEKSACLAQTANGIRLTREHIYFTCQTSRGECRLCEYIIDEMWQHRMNVTRDQRELGPGNVQVGENTCRSMQRVIIIPEIEVSDIYRTHLVQH